MKQLLHSLLLALALTLPAWAQPLGLTPQTRCGTGTISYNLEAPPTGYQLQWSLNNFQTIEVVNNQQFTTPEITAGTSITVYARYFRVADQTPGHVIAAAATAAAPLPLPTVANTNVQALPYSTVTLSASNPGTNKTVQWSAKNFANGPIHSGLSYTFDVPGDANYIIYARVYDMNTGCSGNSLPISVTAPTAVLVVQQAPAVQLWPSPASQQLHIAMPAAGSLRVSDHTGRVVVQQPMLQGTQVLDVSAWPAGVYVAQFSGAAGTASQRFAVVR